MRPPVRKPPFKDFDKWNAQCQKELARILDCHIKGKSYRFKERLYKQERDAIMAEFNNKCAYCEVLITVAMHTGDVEHYRPKGRVRDIHGVEVTTRSGEKHPGYYWLAYDWKNLLPACSACNRPGTAPDGQTFGKHDRFPVRQFHDSDHQMVSQEYPLLVNPRVDNPKDHLMFDPHTGLIIAKPGSEKGPPTIEVLGLNREGLIEDRRRAVRLLKLEYIDAMNKAQESSDSSGIDQLNRFRLGLEPYSAMCVAALEEQISRSVAFLETINPSGQ
jgi:uncharacterized protein (TIGR02646 family)